LFSAPIRPRPRGEDWKIQPYPPAELAAIEEHRGCRLHAGGDAFFLVPVDDGVEPPRISLAQHGVAVESELPRERLQLGVAELLLVREQQIAHLPELALLSRVLGAGRRDGRARMSGKREVLEAEAHLAGERAHRLAQRLRRRGAVRTLVVGVLDDGDGRLRLAALRAVLI